MRYFCVTVCVRNAKMQILLVDDVSNEELKGRVTDNYVKLVSDMKAALISDWLIQESIISVEDWHGIQASGSGRTRFDINRAFLHLLLGMKNPRTFTVFKMALKETGSPWLHGLLDQPASKQEDAKSLCLGIIMLYKAYKCVFAPTVVTVIIVRPQLKASKLQSDINYLI